MWLIRLNYLIRDAYPSKPTKTPPTIQFFQRFFVVASQQESEARKTSESRQNPSKS